MIRNIWRVISISMLLIITPSYAQSILGGMHFYNIPAGYSETVILYNLSPNHRYRLSCSSIAISSIDNVQIRLKSENADLIDRFGDSKRFKSPENLIPLSVPYDNYNQAIIYSLTNLSSRTQHGHCDLEGFIK